jgi:hypothetical protein
LGNGLHIHGNQEHFTTQVSGSSGGLTTSMAGTYNNNIIIWKHGCKDNPIKKKTRYWWGNLSVSRETS